MTARLTLASSFVTLLVPTALWGQRSDSSLPAERIFEALRVHEGATVCEIGAGDGELSIAAARAVGADGRVYTNELGENRLSALRQHVQDSGLSQISVLAGDPARTNFPDGTCDALFMRNVYHHFDDPADMDASISRALKPGGRVAVIDFTPPGREAARPADRDQDGQHGVSADSVTRELKEAGFETVTADSERNRWFMVVMEKPRRN